MGNEFAEYQLLWTSFRTGTSQIYLVDLLSGDTVNLSLSADSYHRYPSWSPDGELAAFTTEKDGAFNLYVRNLRTRATRQLTHERAPAVVGMQTWTADSASIYFGLFGKGEPQMCRIAPDGSGFETMGIGIDPAVSPDGQKIAFAKQLDGAHFLYVANSSGGDEYRVSANPNPFAGMHAVWTPDGDSILYADRVGDALELFICDANGKSPRQLTSFGKAATSPCVSSDSKWITFRVCDEIYWTNPQSSERAYREKKADMRPVWIANRDGSNARVLESLHYHTTIDGSRTPMRRASSA